MTELEVSVPGVGQRRRELRCGMAGRSYDRQGSGRRGYLCHVHPLWSLDPRPHSGLCRVTSILVDLPYRWACVTLRLERERERVALFRVGVRSISRGLHDAMGPDLVDDERGHFPHRLPLPVALGVTIFCDSVSAQGQTGRWRDGNSHDPRWGSCESGVLHWGWVVVVVVFLGR